jgi:hypothetical protein
MIFSDLALEVARREAVLAKHIPILSISSNPACREAGEVSGVDPASVQTGQMSGMISRPAGNGRGKLTSLRCGWLRPAPRRELALFFLALWPIYQKIATG